MAIKIKPPVFGQLLEIDDLLHTLDEFEGDISSKHITAELFGENLKNAYFNGCLIENCRFNASDFSGATFINCRLKNCDFSNCTMDGGYFKQCEIKNVKAMGISLPGSVFQDTLISDSNWEMCDLQRSKAKNWRLENVKMDCAIVSQVDLKNVEMEKVSLMKANFFSTSLAGLNLSSCDIDGLQVSMDGHELKGVRVNVYQAAMFAKLLGLEIDE